MCMYMSIARREKVTDAMDCPSSIVRYIPVFPRKSNSSRRKLMYLEGILCSLSRDQSDLSVALSINL